MKLLEPFLNWQSESQAVRRDVHAHPELSYQEQRASERVAMMVTPRYRTWAGAVRAAQRLPWF